MHEEEEAYRMLRTRTVANEDLTIPGNRSMLDLAGTVSTLSMSRYSRHEYA